MIGNNLMECFRKCFKTMGKILAKKCNQTINRELKSRSKGQIIRQREGKTFLKSNSEKVYPVT